MNYFNILPIVIVETIIIALFEGIFLYTYVSSEEKTLITSSLASNEKTNILNNLVPILQKNNIPSKEFNQLIMETLKPSIEKEKTYIQKEKKYSILILVATIISLLLLLGVYVFIIKKYNQSIEWYKVGIICALTTILIIILEVIYVFVIIFQKEFNDYELQLNVIKGILS